jgi:hypothetical protein
VLGGEIMKPNQWVMFENDICFGCDHPKLMMLIVDPKKLDDTLRVVISCACDGAVFQEEWRNAKDVVVMVGETTCMEAVVMIGDMLKEGQ